MRTSNSQLRYLTLLYNNGHYDSLVDLAKGNNGESLSTSQWTIVMAALFKIGNRDDPQKADVILDFYTQFFFPRPTLNHKRLNGFKAGSGH